MADKLGISIRTYQRIEYGQQLPNVKVAIRLQNLFCTEIGEMIEVDNEKRKIQR